MTKKETIHLFLSEFFNFEHYSIAIKKARVKIHNESSYTKKWKLIKDIIQNKNLVIGEPLDLIHNSANLPLDENSDEEAYKWLNLMIQNIDENSNRIEEY